MIGRDPAQLVIRGAWPDTSEEHTDFEFPLLQISTQQRRLLVIGELDPHEGLRSSADPQPPLTGVCRHFPDLRPFTSRTLEPYTLTPRRVSAAMNRLKMLVVNHPGR